MKEFVRIHAAKDGDTIYVGDIDYTPSGKIFNSLMRIETDKCLFIPWCTHTGDILEIPYIKTNGCILYDESFAKDFPHHELSEDQKKFFENVSEHLHIPKNFESIEEIHGYVRNGILCG